MDITRAPFFLALNSFRLPSSLQVSNIAFKELIVNVSLYVIGLMLFFISCKDSGPESPPFMPGKRDYVWSIDSVDYGSLPGTIQLKSIWGSSPRDVWGVNGDAPDVRDCMWHYDSAVWRRATAGTPITEFTGNKAVYAVWGSATNDVWSIGRKISGDTLSAFIMHFNGTRWIDRTPANVIALNSVLYGIYGVSASDIWAYGYEYALHYDGSQWRPYKVADSLVVASITGNSKAIYASSYSPWGRNVRFIYRFVNNQFQQIDSTRHAESKFGTAIWAQESKLNSFTDGILSTLIRADGAIEVNGWQREFTTPTALGPPFIGRSTNVFSTGSYNLLYHYNGSDWKRLFISVPNHTVSQFANLYGVWSDGNEVFICDTDRGIVYHGR